jgi:bacterioferritin
MVLFMAGRFMGVAGAEITAPWRIFGQGQRGIFRGGLVTPPFDCRSQGRFPIGSGGEYREPRREIPVDVVASSAIVSRPRNPARLSPMKKTAPITRKEMIRLLNEDLAGEYQAIISYIIYSQTMKGAKFQHIATELKKHAGEELGHALKIAKQIDYFNGTPVTQPKKIRLSAKPEDMLRFDLENERDTIIRYRARIRQAEAMGEFALSEVLREIIMQEQEHLTDLAEALGIDNPKIGDDDK